MRTFSLLKGLPIFDLKTGLKMGEVYDLIILDKGLVKGLLVKKGFLKKSFSISIQSIYSFGIDGIMVQDQNVLEPVESFSQSEYTLENDKRLAGRALLTTEGERLGLIEDVYFLEEVGTIIGYELSDGFFSDIIEGKRVVKTIKQPAIGEDAIIVNVQ